MQRIDVKLKMFIIFEAEGSGSKMTRVTTFIHAYQNNVGTPSKLLLSLLQCSQTHRQSTHVVTLVEWFGHTLLLQTLHTVAVFLSNRDGHSLQRFLGRISGAGAG